MEGSGRVTVLDCLNYPLKNFWMSAVIRHRRFWSFRITTDTQNISKYFMVYGQICHIASINVRYGLETKIFLFCVSDYEEESK